MLRFSRVSFLVSLFLLPFSAATAQQSNAVHVALPQQENAEERINFAGKLRMLSQRIPSAACHLSRGVDVEGASALLLAATSEFEKILTALEFGGDTDLNIKNPEKRQKTLVRIHELRKQWEPLKATAQKISAGSANDEDVDFILTHNMAVLQAAVQLVPELVKQYSNPNAVPYAKLLLIDISGRQRMLTQKISKESCIMASDLASQETLAALEQTVQIFEASLDALRFGLPELGLTPPPNSEISESLEVVLGNWNDVKPAIETTMAGDILDHADDEMKFKQLNKTMANMNKVVGMYTAAAKPPS